MWNLQLRGGAATSAKSGYSGDVPEFDLLHFNSGGMGARPTKDGLSATAFPSGIRGIPVEATESITPIVFWRKEFREDSGGAGRFRGGCGQVMEIGGLDDIPFDVLAMYERVDNAPKGRNGGYDGAAGRVSCTNGDPMRPKGQQHISTGGHLVLEMAGGGGFGDPASRDPERVAIDVRNSLVSPKSAVDDYRVVLNEDGSVDELATQSIRGVS